MSQYTSGQYKYLLVKRLQRHFSMKVPSERAYTQSFFWNVFDDSVTVTEDAYNQFVSIMDSQLEYLAEKGIYLCEDIPIEDVESGVLLLTDAFKSIGIDLVVDYESDSTYYLAIFTKPNGEKLTYKVGKLGTSNYFYVNSKSGTEYKYSVFSAPYYTMQNTPVLDTSEINPKIAGIEAYWAYDPVDQSMTITGNGAYAGATAEEQLGSGPFSTLIIGASITRLVKNCMTSNETKMVLLHSSDSNIIIDDNFNSKYGGCNDTVIPLDVYTDCVNAIERLSSDAFSKTITLHSLAEWGG